MSSAGICVAGAIAACAPLAAIAQPLAGPYVSLGAGVNFKQNEIVTPAPSFGYPENVDYTFHPGVAGQVSAGYGLGNGLRVEIEGDALNNVVRGAQVTLPDGTSPPRRGGGVETQYGGFVNVLYDINFGLPIIPYIGVGAGGQAVEHSPFTQSIEGRVGQPLPPSPYPLPATPRGFHDQTVGGFAYQGIAGFSLPVPWVEGLSFTADYRMIGLLDPLPAFQLTQWRSILVVNNGNTNGGGPTPFFASYKTIAVTGNRHFTNDFNHQIVLGVRYAFLTPRAPMPPMASAASPKPPAAPAVRTYLVFFDWDRADLTDRARQIVAQAASTAQGGGTSRIEVDGYTDLSGTPAYNQRLSVRRASSVQAELVRDGVAASEITIAGRGENNPLVQTARGVREPQNRRVEIVLQ